MFRKYCLKEMFFCLVLVCFCLVFVNQGWAVPSGIVGIEYMIQGANTLPNAPDYEWWYGCSPTSAGMMMGFYDDYESVEAVFLEEAEKNPILKAEAAQAPNLAKFAYEQGKKIEAHREMQDVEGYKAKLRAEIEAELKAEAETQQAEKAKKAATLSPSLASARGSSVSEKPKDTLADMFND